MDHERIIASLPADVATRDPRTLKRLAETFVSTVLDALEAEQREPDAWEALDLAYALTLIEGGMPLAAIHYGRRALTPVARRGDDLWTRLDDYPSHVQLVGWLAQIREAGTNP